MENIRPPRRQNGGKGCPSSEIITSEPICVVECATPGHVPWPAAASVDDAPPNRPVTIRNRGFQRKRQDSFPASRRFPQAGLISHLPGSIVRAPVFYYPSNRSPGGIRRWKKGSGKYVNNKIHKSKNINQSKHAETNKERENERI